MSAGSDVFKLVGRILIDNADALGKIEDTTAKAKDLGEALEGAGTSADNTSAKMGSGSKIDTAAVWMGNVLYKVTEKAVQLGESVAKLGFKYDADMETYKVAFTTMMGGNAEAAEQLIGKLRDLGAVTPMNTAGLIRNAKTLMGYGIAADDVVDTLKMLGDAAQGNQSSLDSLVLAYSQMMAAGQLYAQDANQMTNAGFPIWTMLEKQTGKSISALKKLGEQGGITTEMVVGAFKSATSEGGLFFNAMVNQSETFTGKMSTLQDNSEMAAGNLMQAFFDVAKSDVLPKLTESMEKFGQWTIDNQESLQALAEALGDIATAGFDGLLAAFQWITENGSAVALGITTIATAMALAAGSAHPYAYAVTAIVSALAMMKSANRDGDPYDGFLNKFSDEELQTLQNYIDCAKEARAIEAELEAAWNSGADTTELTDAYLAAQNRRDAALEEANAIDGLVSAYNAWNAGQAGNTGGDFLFDVMPKTADGAENNIQFELDGMHFEAGVQMVPDYSQMPSTGAIPGVFTGIDGSHASGLGRVPHDGYIARLHKDEAVLTASQASVWRSGGMMGGTGRLEGMMAQLLGVMGQVASNTSGGTQVVLDSGVLVGQLAPQMDERLGTISGRKGRRN